MKALGCFFKLLVDAACGIQLYHVIFALFQLLNYCLLFNSLLCTTTQLFLHVLLCISPMQARISHQICKSFQQLPDYLPPSLHIEGWRELTALVDDKPKKYIKIATKS